MRLAGHACCQSAAYALDACKHSVVCLCTTRICICFVVPVHTCTKVGYVVCRRYQASLRQLPLHGGCSVCDHACGLPVVSEILCVCLHSAGAGLNPTAKCKVYYVANSLSWSYICCYFVELAPRPCVTMRVSRHGLKTLAVWLIARFPATSLQ